MRNFLVGTALGRALGSLGEYAELILSVIWVTLRRPPAWGLIRDQMYDIGVMSLPVVAITGFSTGMVLQLKLSSNYPIKDLPAPQD